jgi:hypothetical protein
MPREMAVGLDGIYIYRYASSSRRRRVGLRRRRRAAAGTLLRLRRRVPRRHLHVMRHLLPLTDLRRAGRGGGAVGKWTAIRRGTRREKMVRDGGSEARRGRGYKSYREGAGIICMSTLSAMERMRTY